ncbi:hypothetical protein CY34DRAFT_798407 [Suillus luteus UH-Slu-Lm8-n1]|uniref:Unplaced genomic scaffold CY34scaffold_8, whole genome shotgun sequence n=1 Tax=Suillus luteus UH-Slu-Lm8-n1 TaxID=930992 RepID=A0A0D0BEV3_9AGAM|nr:hypothetical protein CY34DRAFT_798407 [Suillus luteus UH-Slu-Lm8-n1]
MSWVPHGKGESRPIQKRISLDEVPIIARVANHAGSGIRRACNFAASTVMKHRFARN